MSRVVVVGAGVGGLTTAALLARAGLDAKVLEAHVYSGGCAQTFVHRGYRFDAGATLAGGFSPGGPMSRLAELLDLCWMARRADPAMLVHRPDVTQGHHWAVTARRITTAVSSSTGWTCWQSPSDHHHRPAGVLGIAQQAKSGLNCFCGLESRRGFHGSGSRTNAAETAENPLPAAASLAWKRSGVRFPSGPPTR